MSDDDSPRTDAAPLELSEEDQGLLDLLRDGSKIQAIKRRRELTGEGLKEAKDYVDDLQHRRGHAAPPEPSQEDQELLDLLRGGSKIQAIKRRRELTGEGLKEAKDYVDDLQHRRGLAAPAKRGGCFIATAACGSPNHPAVLRLRRFRDERLLPMRLGRLAVALYYWLSPPLAAIIRPRPRLRALLRRTLIVPLARLLDH